MTHANGAAKEDDWERLQTLFHRLEPASPEEREEILRTESADDELRERLSSLLLTSDRLAAESSHPKVDSIAGPAASPQRSIGPYMVLRSLGSGGTGMVYLVTRDVAGVAQRAALKVLLPQASVPSFFDRFEREQQILASLDHPNITRLLDAGLAEDGQPYLVMEYVAGEHLDVYCDAHKLPVDARLQLFVRICEAVDYAHRNLVVHLDLKPSNILVTEEGVPKLLDFGTSKLVSRDGLLTTTLQATPSFASPEQLRNEAVTTACDVYSLGVILFSVLSGGRPYPGLSMAALMERAFTDVDPPQLHDLISEETAAARGSTVRRLTAELAGDLDTIVRKCLQSDPLHRYASVLGLRDDLVRYLEGRPILARPQTNFYRFSKFVLRNRSSVAVAAVFLTALTVSLGLVWRSQRQASLEGQRALHMQTFLYRLLKTANSNYTGKPVSTVGEFLSLGIRMLPDYIKEPSDLHAAQLALAESIYWNSDYASAGRYFQQIAASSHSTRDFDVEAQACAYLADIAYSTGRHAEALSRSAEALAISRRPGVSGAAHALCARSYALVRVESGQHTDENRHLLEYSVQEAIRSGLPAHDVGQYRYYLGSELANEGRLTESEQEFSLAVKMNDSDPLSMCDNTLIIYGLGQLRLKQDRNREAADVFDNARRRFVTCYGAADPDSIEAKEYWALALLRAGEVDRAVAPLRDSLRATRALVPAGSRKLFESLAGLAQADLLQKQLAEADAFSSEALTTVVGKVPAADVRLAKANLVRAQVLAAESRYSDALPLARNASTILKAVSTTPENRRYQDEVSRLQESINRHLATR